MPALASAKGAQRLSRGGRGLGSRRCSARSPVSGRLQRARCSGRLGVRSSCRNGRISELDTDQAWTQRLSGGEQQRLAIARALLLRPDWLYLDEATASLDPEGEAELYRTLRERLPGTTIISIAHRAEVSAWHEDGLVFGDKRLAPAALPAAAD